MREFESSREKFLWDSVPAARGGRSKSASPLASFSRLPLSLLRLFLHFSTAATFGMVVVVV